VLTTAVGVLPQRLRQGWAAPQLPAPEAAILRVDPSGVRPEPNAISVAFPNALRTLADRGPLLVAVDGVQPLDRASAGVLAFAARAAAGART
jgi:hypothetical protein